MPRMKSTDMADFKIENIGFYEWLELDDRGLPKGGKPFDSDVLPSGHELAILYFRLSGTPGSYRITIAVKSDLKDPKSGGTLSLNPKNIDIPAGGAAHVTIPFRLDKIPPGTHRFALSIDDKLAVRFAFTVE